MIYGKNIAPEIVDAKYSNSLRLTPTLLDILKINSENHFLGTSLFEQKDVDFVETLYVEGFQCFVNEVGKYREVKFSECAIVKRFYDYNGF